MNQRNMKNTLETRQAQLFMPIYGTFSSREFQRAANELTKWQWSDYDDYMKKYSYQNNPEAALDRNTLIQFFEGVGVLVKRKLIDPSFVDDLISSYIIYFWEKWGPIYFEQRKRQNFPTVAEYTEFLYNQVRPIWVSQHVKDEVPQ